MYKNFINNRETTSLMQSTRCQAYQDMSNQRIPFISQKSLGIYATCRQQMFLLQFFFYSCFLYVALVTDDSEQHWRLTKCAYMKN